MQLVVFREFVCVCVSALHFIIRSFHSQQQQQQKRMEPPSMDESGAIEFHYTVEAVWPETEANDLENVN